MNTTHTTTSTTQTTSSTTRPTFSVRRVRSTWQGPRWQVFNGRIAADWQNTPDYHATISQVNGSRPCPMCNGLFTEEALARGVAAALNSQQQLQQATTSTDEFNGLVAQALNRMDTKNETAAEAAEAVTGGNRTLDAQIVRALQGEHTFTIGGAQ